MQKSSTFSEPYTPSKLHAFHHWIDTLPGPYWLFAVAFVLFTGILNHIVAWNEDVLALGEINWDFAFTGFHFAYFLFAIDFLFRVAKNSLLEFRPILNVNNDEFSQILFEFTHLPARITLIYFGVGGILGVAIGIYLLPIAPELNYAFPEMEIFLYFLTIGIIFIAIYMVIRTLRLVSRLFERVEKVDIFDQHSIYAMSRYSAWIIIIYSIPVYLARVLVPGFTAVTNYFFVWSMIVMYMIMFTIFWLPLRGINRKLILEKRRLLTEVNSRIKTTFDLIHSRVDNQEFENMFDLKETLESLKAEKEIIESLHTTPWRTGTITALTTAVLLPLLGTLLTSLVSWIIKL